MFHPQGQFWSRLFDVEWLARNVEAVRRLKNVFTKVSRFLLKRMRCTSDCISFQRGDHTVVRAIRHRHGRRKEIRTHPIALAIQDYCKLKADHCLPRHDEVKSKMLGQMIEQIWWYLPVDALAMMAQTCHNMTDRIQGHLRHRFKHGVSPFVKSHHNFREKLREGSAVIGGSVELGMVMPMGWMSKNMEVYVRSDCHVVESYLIEQEGYKPRRYNPVVRANPLSLGTHPWQSEPYAVRSTMTLQRPSDYEEDKYPATITIIMSSDRSPLTPVFSFSATYAMNWITADSVNVGYPNMTLRKIGIMCMSDSGVMYGRPSWMGPGFTLVKRVDQREERKTCGEFCLARFRSTTDGWTLRLSFNGGLKKMKDSVRPRQWSMRGRTGLDRCENPSCSSYNLRVCVANVSAA